MKKIQTVALLCLGLVLSGCSTISQNSSLATEAQPQQAFIKEALSSLSLVSAQANVASSASIKYANESTSSDTSTSTTTETVDDAALIEQIKGYLPTIESALSNDTLIKVTTDTASDRSAYANMYVVSYTDLNGKVNNVTLYFNEVASEETVDEDDVPAAPSDPGTTSNEPVVAPKRNEGNEANEGEDGNKALPPEGGHRDHNHDRDIEVSADKTLITGVALYNDVEYTIAGSKEYDSTENETEVSFRLQYNETSWIHIKEEVSASSIEYKYTLFENRKKVESFKLEIENDDDILEVSLKQSSLDSRLALKFTFLTLDSHNYIYARIMLSGHEHAKAVFEKIVNSETGEVTYNVVNQ